ncbi:MAG TPA: septum formation protein Maf [Rhodobacteraceae bacterium]|nr:septum formation protein Maf [Paracoccaceae bacterium]
MSVPLILASGSDMRSQLMRNAGLAYTVIIPRIDEQNIKDALVAEGAHPRDIADALAEIKARKVSSNYNDAMTIGCDQILSIDGSILSKPVSIDAARDQLRALRAKRHMLLSAAVVYHEGKPIWRHVGQVRLRMRNVSDAYIDDYVDRNWDDIKSAVGSYKLESEGVRLFDSIEGDYFHVLGMPLLELLAFLTLRGVIDG